MKTTQFKRRQEQVNVGIFPLILKILEENHQKLFRREETQQANSISVLPNIML